MIADPLLEYRAEFPILETTTYLAAHTLGPVCRASLEALAGYGHAWATRGVRAWADGWWALPERVGDAIGRLMNAPAGTVSTPAHATEAMAMVLSSLDFPAARPRIVTTDLEFPSVLYQVAAWGQRGAEIVIVPSDGLSPPIEALLEAIDERTRLVSICQVYFRNAALLDVARVVRRAHAVGALVCLDAYQSLGTVPLDVQALGVDFVVGGSVKWVLGGPGVGYVYARPGLLEGLEPSLRGWSGHADPFRFETGWRPAAGARRFATGTPNVPALTAALPGYELVAKIGVGAIREKSLRQTGRLMQLAEAAGLAIVNPKPAAERGGSVVIDVTPLAGPDRGHAVSAALNARDFVLDYRVGAGVRLAPHFYTRDDELAAVVAAMLEVIETRADAPYRERGRVT
ncbi:MAG: aminotransferase class V-fold PLP-dependent enzyme [Polyangiaceae bacterium]|jgi:kynureninase|nr:aminotransferase class V-fold PLP-dependent enzyme [Polyangiaceae bacterium]